jgi:hypothetical protein
MIKTAQSLAGWFAQFGLPVYLDSDVPDGAEAPYITIPMADPYWDRKASFQFNIWYRTTSNLPPMQKADEILAAVGEGIRLYFDGGLLVLRIDPDTPTQIMVEDDYRCARVSLTLNAYHLPGV